MKDYRNLGLDSKLNKQSNLAIKTDNLGRDLSFDYKTDINIVTTPKVKDGAITSEKVDSISFNQASGGTITLGGAGNGNGILRVLNSANVQKVTISNSGVAVIDGNISISNAVGTTILDSTGVVSTTNFPRDQIFSDVTNSTTGTTAVDLPGATLDSFILSRAANVYITMSAWGYNNGFGNDGHSVRVVCNDNIDGNLITYPIFGQWVLSSIDFAGSTASNSFDEQAVTMGVIQNLSAGTHTLKLQYYASTGGTATVGAFLLSYLVLGA
jgi:hypothetical protein